MADPKDCCKLTFIYDHFRVPPNHRGDREEAIRRAPAANRQGHPARRTRRRQGIALACWPGACNRHGLRRFGALSIYPDGRATAFWDTIPNPQYLRGYLMSKPGTTFLIFTFLIAETAFAQPPVRKFDDPGSPPFKVLKTGENPPLDAAGNYVMGPEYKPASERKVVAGVPQGKVKQFTIDSKETKLFNPGIARKVFGKVDPKNPKTLIVETHAIDYKRQITVYIPARYKVGSEAPFLIIHDGPQGKPNMQL